MRRLSVNQSLKTRSWMMGAVNVVLLVLLVWTFTAVCEADDITSNCEDVTAHLGDEITFTCTVSYPNKKCCMKMYKFMYTAANDDPICKNMFRSDSCKQESIFSCPHTPNKAMTTKFKFFVQTTCGQKTPEFSVNITEAVKDDTAGGSDRAEDGEFGKSTEKTSGLDNSSVAIIICLLGCFIIVAVSLFFWMRRKPSRSTLEYNVCVCKNKNNFSEHSDGEAMLKETSVNVQIEKSCQCKCNHSSTSI